MLGEVRCTPKATITPSNTTSSSVVTGASDGIGKEFALQLAAAGFNILLVARNEAALTSVATEIGVFIFSYV